jgi:pimeloyl-ACP methyl ester carboxylesterase
MEEQAMLDELGSIIDSVTVPTRLGPTHVWRWPASSGPGGDGAPVLMLHGSSGMGSTWARWADPLAAAGHPVFAPDTVGDVGRTEHRVGVSDVEQLVDWLDDTLAGLGVESAHVVGTSYGGFLGLQLAAHRPARVRSLYLMEPAGVVELDMRGFIRWGAKAMFSTFLPRPLRRIAARRLRMPLIEEGRLLRLAFYGQRHHIPGLLPPPLATDGELASLSASGIPAQVLLGAESEVFRTADMIGRLRSAWPTAVVEAFAGSGHALQLSEEEALIDRLLTFVGDEATAAH